MWYGWLVALLIVAAAARLVPAVQRVSLQPVHWTRHLFGRHSRVDEVAVAASVIGILSYFAREFYVQGSIRGKPMGACAIIGIGPSLDRPTREDACAAHIGSALGHMLNVLVAMVMLPIGKGSSLATALDVSYEQAISYHRIVGTLTIIFGAAHIVTEQVGWALDGEWWRKLVSYVDVGTGQDIWPWVVPMM